MEKTEKKPNIIMILADDQGPWAMHCAGTPELYTPNLDRIAEHVFHHTYTKTAYACII